MSAKDNPVVDVLRKLKEAAEIIAKFKPLQEAIAALEKIVNKSIRKSKSASAAEEEGQGQSGSRRK